MSLAMLVFLLSLVFNCNGMLCSTKAQIECGMKTVESFRDRKSRCATEETERGCKPDECQDEYLFIDETVRGTCQPVQNAVWLREGRTNDCFFVFANFGCCLQNKHFLGLVCVIVVHKQIGQCQLFEQRPIVDQAIKESKQTVNMVDVENSVSERATWSSKHHRDGRGWLKLCGAMNFTMDGIVRQSELVNWRSNDIYVRVFRHVQEEFCAHKQETRFV